MTIGAVLIWSVLALLLAAAVSDLTCFKIPNILTASILVLFVLTVFVISLSGHSLQWNDIWLHLLAGGMGLLVGILLFALGWIGGGDSKLFAVVSLWLGWNALLQYTILAVLLGGLLTIALLTIRRVPPPLFLAAQPWFSRLWDAKSGVPYGIALAIAAIRVLPDTDLFRLALLG